VRPGSLPEREAMALGRDGNALDRSRAMQEAAKDFQHYVPVWKHTGTKIHPTASLLAKPTPINIDSGSDRFAMFNIVGTSPSSIA
jgi:hypothetical protein